MDFEAHNRHERCLKRSYLHEPSLVGHAYTGACYSPFGIRHRDRVNDSSSETPERASIQAGKDLERLRGIDFTHVGVMECVSLSIMCCFSLFDLSDVEYL